MGGRVDYSQGKLYARPGHCDQSTPLQGLQPLGTGARRDGLIYTPSSYEHGKPTPLCIIMHGAGGNAKGALFPPMEDIAEKVCCLDRLIKPVNQAVEFKMCMFLVCIHAPSGMRIDLIAAPRRH